MMKRSPKPLSPPSTESGFTLIESLVAVLIVTVLLVAIAPVIALSVATRVQARRVELATQAARAYIDNVRSGTIKPTEVSVRLDEVITNPTSGKDIFIPKRNILAEVAAPAPSALNCGDKSFTYPYCRPLDLGLYCYDLDGGGCSSTSSKDLIVQAFRSRTSVIPAKDKGSKGYLLGVRVYRASAFDGSGAKLLKMSDVKTGATLTKDQLTKTYAGGSGNRKAPLVEITTEIRGEGTSYDSLCDRLGGCNPPSGGS